MAEPVLWLVGLLLLLLHLLDLLHRPSVGLAHLLGLGRHERVHLRLEALDERVQQGDEPDGEEDDLGDCGGKGKEVRGSRGSQTKLRRARKREM